MARLLDIPLGVRSCPGHGSTFWVTVPPGLEATVPAVVGTAAEELLAGRRVAVVDDDAPVRDGMASLLTQWGVAVVTAPDSVQLLAALDGQPAPDLLISDWMLARETGPDVLHAIRLRYPACRTLLMTADSSISRRLEADALGVELLVKPVHPARLRAMIYAALTKPAQHLPTTALRS
jgi:DNA-binding response OmpR family regulator